MDPAINTALVLILLSLAVYCVVKSLWDAGDDNPYLALLANIEAQKNPVTATGTPWSN